ncbi:MAG: Rne/Rng family ribonuclease [Myxococcales bacterium]|nr:Rne/Rng family ribonuclease [Myxococcales bacterium]
MANSLVMNCSPHEIRVGVLEEGRVVEIFVERRKDASLVGNLYKGRVTRVLPGMQAAFVDIGLERAAFLYVADVVDPRRSLLGTRDAATSTLSEARLDTFNRPIQSLLNEGQEIMVQVAKEPLGTKGARVTSHVSIAGRHLVYMPTVDHVGISRRIAEEEERRRLKEILEELVPQGGGFVARTAAEGRSPDELRADLDFLRQVWNDILTRTESGPAPVTLYEDLDLVLRTARDLVTPELEAIYIDDEADHDRLVRFMRRFMPRYMDRVRRYEGKDPIFDAFGVEVELNRALGRKVWLPSGGYLIIDQTEALCAIDINTGRYVGRRNLEDTILRTNLEAIHEIVHQLRLRNIGGIIIIDFIDMDKEANRNRVFTEFSDALQRDRAKTNILKISDLGLVEMTRKRVRESLSRSMSEPCFYCDGTGLLKSRTTVAHEIYRAALREAEVMDDEPQVCVAAHPRVAETLETEERSMMAELEARLDKRLVIEARTDFHLEHFELSGTPADEDEAVRTPDGSPARSAAQ